MERSFRDLRIATNLAKKLGEDVAENVRQFTQQIRRLNLYGKHSAWQKVDVEDHELICRIYQTPGMAIALAQKLNRMPAAEVEEFRRQIIDYQTSKTC